MILFHMRHMPCTIHNGGHKEWRKPKLLPSLATPSEHNVFHDFVSSFKFHSATTFRGNLSLLKTISVK
jgi:hypothetical protein